MVMDTTGSMGTTYMAQARTAAHNLMDKIYGGSDDAVTESPDIRVGLVPFSGAVRLNTSAFDYNASWAQGVFTENLLVQVPTPLLQSRSNEFFADICLG